MSRLQPSEPPRYRIEFKKSAAKELRALPATMLARIDEAILSLATDPRPHGVKKLAGKDDLYRIRVGDYRVIYTIQDQALVILVIRIAHRRDVYRD